MPPMLRAQTKAPRRAVGRSSTAGSTGRSGMAPPPRSACRVVPRPATAATTVTPFGGVGATSMPRTRLGRRSSAAAVAALAAATTIAPAAVLGAAGAAAVPSSPQPPVSLRPPTGSNCVPRGATTARSGPRPLLALSTHLGEAATSEPGAANGDDAPASPKKRRTALPSDRRSSKKKKTTAISRSVPPVPAAAAASPRPTFPPRTESFDAVWAGTFDPGTSVLPHTLILGTHPSVSSLERRQYYGHPLNAFWWIAGDCLGFRRGPGLKIDGTAPLHLSQHLRHGPEDILTYDEQLRTFTSNGFALWDVVRECRREGSLDSSIRDEVPNDVPALCRRFPSVKRVVLANGGTGAKLFVKHFGASSWLTSQPWTYADHPASERAFGALYRKKHQRQARRGTPPAAAGENGQRDGVADEPLVLVAALSVSPAAASYGYVEKRDFWEEYVYKPGLELHRRATASRTAKGDPGTQ